jgi:polar amino acid transport system substrate-binding protein
VLARGPAHIGVRMGEQNLCNWINVFLYSAVMSGDLDKLTMKYLGYHYEPLPAL